MCLTRVRNFVLGIAAAVSLAGGAWAQDYPTKPIRIIVPFAPGGLADTSARAVAEKLSARLGKSVDVENRAGASGNIGTQSVAQAAPDGYTLLLGFDGTMVINPHIFSKLPFDTMNDFAPITKLGDATPLLAAHPSVPAKDIRELIALDKAKPGTEQTFLHLQQHGSTAGSSVPAYSMDQLHTLVGFADVWAFEKRYPGRD